MVRTFTIEAREKGRMSMSARVQIITEPGRLTRDELSHLKVKAADAFMLAMHQLPYLHVGISEIKVKG